MKENILININEKIKNFNKFLFYTSILFVTYISCFLLVKNRDYLNIILLILFALNTKNLYKATLDYNLLPKGNNDITFRDYLLFIAICKNKSKKHYSLKTCENYITAIEKCSDIFNTNIWKIKDSNQIDTILNQLNKNNTYVNLNKSGHQMYKNGLERYKEFLEYKKKQEEK